MHVYEGSPISLAASFSGWFPEDNPLYLFCFQAVDLFSRAKVI